MNLRRPTSIQEDSNPGLSALVVYFHPVAREKVLRTLVSLGVFAREIDHSSGAPVVPRTGAADFAICFATGASSEVDTISAYGRLVNAVCVVVPPDCEASALNVLRGDHISRGSEETPLERDVVLRVAQLARRRAEGKLAAAQPAPSVIFGGVVFQPGQPLLQRGNRVAGLSPTEFGVLRALVSARGSVVSKSVLQFELTGGEEYATDGYLKTVVLRIRRKVEGLGGDASHLAAIRGSGYVLRA